MTDKTPQNKADIPVNTPTAPAGTTNTARDSKSRALPQADALKERFKAGSIPLQTDFADLIDLANIGRQAVGGADGQTGPANGFTVSSAGLLQLKPSAGITVDDSGVGLKLKNDTTLYGDSAPLELREGGKFLGIDMGDGIECRSNGISVKTGDGIQLAGDSVTVKAASGITVGSSGVDVKAGNGIAVTSSGVNIKLASGTLGNGGGGQGSDGATSGSSGGLSLTPSGLSVDAGQGIQINAGGVSIKLAENSGLSADEKNGLKIVPEQQFQKGMVMMFAGTATEIPKGWALCDGSLGTPNLIDRFILCSKPADSGKFNTTILTGSGNTKVYSKESSSETISGTISIGSTTLNETQIPSHKHIGGMPYRVANYTQYGRAGLDGDTSIDDTKDSFYISSSYPVYPYTSSTGGGKGHTHTATLSTTDHKHEMDIIPPYYTLAFIIKL